METVMILFLIAGSFIGAFLLGDHLGYKRGVDHCMLRRGDRNER